MVDRNHAASRLFSEWVQSKHIPLSVSMAGKTVIFRVPDICTLFITCSEVSVETNAGVKLAVREISTFQEPEFYSKVHSQIRQVFKHLP